MKIKVFHLEIRCCYNCPHYTNAIQFPEPFCIEAWNESGAGKKEMDFVIDPGRIPEWCPLPDLKE